MLAQSEIEYAISIQNRCYKLLQWLGNAENEGFVSVIKSHAGSFACDAARIWVETHIYNIPDDCRPPAGQIEAFSNFFGTYLETSFELVANLKAVYVSDCGCSCPMCSQLANPRYLKPKSLGRADKERAHKLRIRRLEMLAREEGLPSFELRIREGLEDEDLRRHASFSAYGSALLNRLKGISDGPAVLALWRDLAWTREGYPIRRFKLTAQDIMQAEKSLLNLLKTHAGQ